MESFKVFMAINCYYLQKYADRISVLFKLSFDANVKVFFDNQFERLAQNLLVKKLFAN